MGKVYPVNDKQSKEVLGKKVKKLENMIKSVCEPKNATMKNGKLESMVEKMEKKDDAIKKSNDKFVSAASDESCKSLLK